MKTELLLVQEELCRIIASATRWQTVEEAWKALLQARMMAGELTGEEDHINPCGKTLSTKP